MASHVLIITTNHSELAGKPNGTYLPELTHSLDALTAAGVTWDLASPKGGKIPGYGADADELTKKMLATSDFSDRIENTLELASVDASKYDGLFYPGGYGLLFDLVDNGTSHAIARQLYEQGKPVTAVCHGPAALSDVKLSDGRWLVEGRNVTGFTRAEEVAMNTLDAVPFLVEERMMERGATYQKRAAWKEFLVEDGLLITGQNPGSAAAVGKALAAALAK